MTETDRLLKGKGELDYDYINDILFFKIKSRDYDHSVEIDNLVIDIDSENFIVGVQIFDASKFLGIKKYYLRAIPRCDLHASIRADRLEIRLTFKVNIRNKIVQVNPIILEALKNHLPDSETACVAA